MKTLMIVQRFLPHYRVGFFERLSRSLQDRDWRLCVLYSRRLGPAGTEALWAHSVPGIRIPVRVGDLRETAVFPFRLEARLREATPRLIVTEDLSGFPGSALVGSWARREGVPYLIWGPGSLPGKRRSRLRRLLRRSVHRFRDGAAGFLAYSRHGARTYEAYGRPFQVVPNACRAAHSTDERRRVLDSISQRYVSGPLRLVSIGRLHPQKRFAQLLNAVAQMADTVDVRLDIIGGGGRRDALERVARRLGIVDRVTFRGPIYDTQAKEEVLLSSHLGVLPGRGGLAIQEMLWHGLPVISGHADGTEEDLLRDGVNGWRIEGTPTVMELVRHVSAFVDLPREEKEKLAESALETVAREFNLEGMVAAFLWSIGRV